MKFYYIWAKLFSFELKNTKKEEEEKTLVIRNMSPKNAIKKINIQKSYLVHFGFVQSTLVLFGLVSPLDPILFTSVLFGPHWFYSVHFVHFGPL